MPKIIGFGHRSRMGKDTAAGFLVSYLRTITRNKLIVKTSFANKLKSIAHDLYKSHGLQDELFYEKEENQHLRNLVLPGINKSPVEIWIELGTTVGRSIYSETWVDYPFTKECDYLILTDVRFLNEVLKIKKLGGVVVKVTNPGVPYRDSVADDALESFNKWDATIINDGDFKSLNEKVITTCKGLLWI